MAKRRGSSRLVLALSLGLTSTVRGQESDIAIQSIDQYVEVEVPGKKDTYRMRYRTWGEGDRELVFLHGSPGSLEDFYDSIVPLYTKLGAQHTYSAFFVDLPGYGESERPLEGDDWLPTHQNLAAMLHDGLTGLGVEHAILVGHSWGALIAGAYQVSYPAEVAALVLIAPVATAHPGHTLAPPMLNVLTTMEALEPGNDEIANGVQFNWDAPAEFVLEMGEMILYGAVHGDVLPIRLKALSVGGFDYSEIVVDRLGIHVDQLDTLPLEAPFSYVLPLLVELGIEQAFHPLDGAPVAYLERQKRYLGSIKRFRTFAWDSYVVARDIHELNRGSGEQAAAFANEWLAGARKELGDRIGGGVNLPFPHFEAEAGEQIYVEMSHAGDLAIDGVELSVRGAAEKLSLGSLTLPFDIRVRATVFTVGEDLPTYFDDVGAPVILRSGSDDKVVDIRFHHHQLVSKASRRVLLDHEIIEGAGHMIPITHPLVVALAINRAARMPSTMRSLPLENFQRVWEIIDDLKRNVAATDLIQVRPGELIGTDVELLDELMSAVDRGDGVDAYEARLKSEGMDDWIDTIEDHPERVHLTVGAMYFSYAYTIMGFHGGRLDWLDGDSHVKTDEERRLLSNAEQALSRTIHHFDRSAGVVVERGSGDPGSCRVRPVSKDVSPWTRENGMVALQFSAIARNNRGLVRWRLGDRANAVADFAAAVSALELVCDSHELEPVSPTPTLMTDRQLLFKRDRDYFLKRLVR